MKRRKPKPPLAPPPEPSREPGISIELDTNCISVSGNVVAESVCDRARRIAREERDAAKREREAKHAAFLDTICAPHERTLNDDGTYTICGWRWELFEGCDNHMPYLVCHDTYKGQRIDRLVWDSWAHGGPTDGYAVTSISDLGRALLSFDQRKAEIDAAQAKSLWARFKRLFA